MVNSFPEKFFLPFIALNSFLFFSFVITIIVIDSYAVVKKEQKIAPWDVVAPKLLQNSDNKNRCKTRI